MTETQLGSAYSTQSQAELTVDHSQEIIISFNKVCGVLCVIACVA